MNKYFHYCVSSMTQVNTHTHAHTHWLGSAADVSRLLATVVFCEVAALVASEGTATLAIINKSLAVLMPHTPLPGDRLHCFQMILFPCSQSVLVMVQTKRFWKKNKTKNFRHFFFSSAMSGFDLLPPLAAFRHCSF